MRCLKLCGVWNYAVFEIMRCLKLCGVWIMRRLKLYAVLELCGVWNYAVFEIMRCLNYAVFELCGVWNYAVFEIMRRLNYAVFKIMRCLNYAVFEIMRCLNYAVFEIMRCLKLCGVWNYAVFEIMRCLKLCGVWIMRCLKLCGAWIMRCLCAAVVYSGYYSGLWTRRFLVRVPSGCQYSMRLDRLHMAHPSLHPFGVVHWVPVLSNIAQDSDCYMGVNRIDSCNFELCSQGQLCTTINSTVFKDGLGRQWAAMSNKTPGCHLANAWRSRSKHILQWRYTIPQWSISVHSLIHI